MSKDQEKETSYERKELEVDTQHYIGDFIILLDENGNLRVNIYKNRCEMSIKPSSSNCVVISNLKKIRG